MILKKWGKKMLPPLAPNPRVCAGRKRMLAQLDRIWFDPILDSGRKRRGKQESVRGEEDACPVG